MLKILRGLSVAPRKFGCIRSGGAESVPLGKQVANRNLGTFSTCKVSFEHSSVEPGELVRKSSSAVDKNRHGQSCG